MASRNDYYRILQINKYSNSLELKQSYRRLALIYHPDKNPNDPNAAQKFQELSEAFEVDPREVFARVFGGSSFESWVGKLSLMENAIEQLELEKKKKDELDVHLGCLNNYMPNASKQIEDAQSVGPWDQVKRVSHNQVHENWKRQERQRIEEASKRSHAENLKSFEDTRLSDRAQRVAKLQDLLKNRIARLPDHASQDGVETFVQELVAEREILKLESFGIPILHTIATVYRSSANAYFGSQGWFGIPSAYYFSKGVTENIKDLMWSYGAVKEAKMALEMSSKDDKPSTSYTEAGRQEDTEDGYMEKVVAGKVLNMAWFMSKMEIKAVLKDVTTGVLYDQLASPCERDFRAHALHRIADVFQEACKEDGDTIDEEFEMLIHNAAKVKLRENIIVSKGEQSN